MEAVINKKALYDYEVLERLEVGIVLSGQEVKSVKNGGALLTDSFVRIDKGEMYLWNALINKYKFSGDRYYDDRRSRKLLAKKSEIVRLSSKAKQGRLTIIPLKMYSSHGRIKIEVGLCRGKKTHEKKNKEKERDLQRELHREKREFLV